MSTLATHYEDVGSWRLQREERRVMIAGRRKGTKRNDCWSKYLSSFCSLNEQSYAGSHFLSHFHFYHQSLRLNTCPAQRPSALATWWSFNIYLVYYVASWAKSSLQNCWQLIFMTRLKLSRLQSLLVILNRCFWVFAFAIATEIN